MLQEIDECVAAGHDFAFETTIKDRLAGKSLNNACPKD
jgi:hypothetical protein